MASSIFDLQYKLLYYPSSFVPSKDFLRAIDLQFWPSELHDYRGYVSDSGWDEYRGTVIVFHGNAGTAADRTYYVNALGPLGYRVLLAEYPQYGGRSGELGEASFVSDAGATVKLAFNQYGPRIYLLGESLGCGVVAATVKDLQVPIDGIVMITPWDTLRSVVRKMLPIFPVGWFLKDNYDNIGNLKSYRGKIALIGAERDDILPIGHANKLFEALPVNKRKWVILGARHNDWLMFIDKQWWQDVMRFVSDPGK
jgi:pimeloyl-ACP methyl ester carboxylesterase